MIKFENTRIAGFEPAIRGMRNPKNSWDRSDSSFFDPDINGMASIINEHDMCAPLELLQVGMQDAKLMTALDKGGPVHAKYRRQIVVWVDITAPLYWWKEFDTYRFGRERNSCSTMHKIAEREFVLNDFSNEHLDYTEDCAFIAQETNGDLIYGEGRGLFDSDVPALTFTSIGIHKLTIAALNYWRTEYLKATEAKDTVRAKHCWWQLIQLNPDCYNQKATIMMSYEVLAAIYQYRDGHKLDEWHDLRKWIETLPESWIITGEEVMANDRN